MSRFGDHRDGFRRGGPAAPRAGQPPGRGGPGKAPALEARERGPGCPQGPVAASPAPGRGLADGASGMPMLLKPNHPQPES